MLLKHLALERGVYIDEDDIQKYGHLSAYIDDQCRVKVSLGSRELGKAFLHQLVMDTTDPVDHINRNPTDNRKENLRKATLTQNQGNRTINNNNTSGYKGVSYHKASKKFRARLGLAKGEMYLGLFLTAEAAAKAYNDAATKYFGEFASLNKIGET